DARAAEGGVAFDRAVDDRLASKVEAGVEQDRNARARAVRLEQGMEARRHAGLDGLHARGAVDVSDRGQSRSPFAVHGKDTRHEAAQPSAARWQLEESVRLLDRHCRREGPEFLPILDAAVE